MAELGSWAPRAEMTRFVTNGFSYGINTSAIRKIDIRKTAALVFFNNDEQGAGSPVYKALQAFLDRQDSCSHHIIPAAPGFTLLTFVAPDDATRTPLTSRAT